MLIIRQGPQPNSPSFSPIFFLPQTIWVLTPVSFSQVSPLVAGGFLLWSLHLCFDCALPLEDCKPAPRGASQPSEYSTRSAQVKKKKRAFIREFGDVTQKFRFLSHLEKLGSLESCGAPWCPRFLPVPPRLPQSLALTGTCWKCKFPGPFPNLLMQSLRGAGGLETRDSGPGSR